MQNYRQFHEVHIIVKNHFCNENIPVSVFAFQHLNPFPQFFTFPSFLVDISSGIIEKVLVNKVWLYYVYSRLQITQTFKGIWERLEFSGVENKGLEIRKKWFQQYTLESSENETIHF